MADPMTSLVFAGSRGDCRLDAPTPQREEEEREVATAGAVTRLAAQPVGKQFQTGAGPGLKDASDPPELSSGWGEPAPAPPCPRREEVMDSLNVPAFTPKHSVPPRFGDYFTSASPFRRQLASVRKQTPFGQTPSRRKIPQSSPLQENVDPQKITFLLHKQWTLYTLTPMYRFSYTNLKKYSTLLKSFLAAEKQKGQAVEMGEDFNFKVIFSTLSGMKGTHRDPAAFLVQIVSKSQLSSKNAEPKVVWTGWFCCVCGDSLVENVPDDFTCLPLFLANGAESNTALIGAWFQKTFDCRFTRLTISAFNLSWMAAMWTSCSLEHYGTATELLWSVPCSPQSLDISYAINPEDAKALWDSVHQTPEEITQEEVDLFIDCLCSHFHRHFKINLSATSLVRVSTPVASAHTDGKIKILCSKYLIGVLAFLTELAIFQIE